MRMIKKYWLPIGALIVVVALFLVAAATMSRSDNRPAAQMAIGDPARPGASLRRAESAMMADGQEAAPAVIEEASPIASAGEKVPVPLFWMALGALCASVGVLVATRERKAY